MQKQTEGPVDKITVKHNRRLKNLVMIRSEEHTSELQSHSEI